ncbi:MAG: HAMP domain-containing histidine kinase [Tenericutes bacterium]|nr:HAMP domain-containing histidine kinase [Mycoplasmatota bacterium]
MIISIFIAIFISIRLSKKLSKPIISINEKSKELGKGNFDIKFDENEYLELQELSNTLNETTNKLKEKDKLQKEIISNVSHDLKTPLTIIKGYSEVIRDIKSSKENRNIKLNNIINEVDNLNLMINNLLETSKLEVDNYLKLEKTDISKVVDKVINRLDKIIKDKNIVINYSSNKLISNVDKDKIEQVIYNLLINAINHVGKDNTIIININDNILEITDHGKGIEDTTHNSKTSNGLGLYIVKTILEKHNLEYGVESKKNIFTKFWIKF